MNTFLKVTLTGLAVVIGISASAPTFADAPPRGADLTNVARAAALTPMPMRFFCKQNPHECAGDSRSQITATPNLLAVLQQVNVQVNRAILPQQDRSVADVWSLNPARGDCEDYALSKRSALIRQGVAAGALRIAVTKTRRGEPHAVLIVRTNEGDLVLDNLSSTVKTLQATGYQITAMSSPNPTRWVAGSPRAFGLP